MDSQEVQEAKLHIGKKIKKGLHYIGKTIEHTIEKKGIDHLLEIVGKGIVGK